MFCSSGSKIFCQILVPYYDNGQYGFSDINGEIVIEPQYEDVEFFTCGSLAKVIKKGSLIIINDKGEELASYPGVTINSVQILPVIQDRDTFEHLKWISIGEDKYQILNITSQTLSATYIIEKPAYFSRLLKPRNMDAFRNGFLIGKTHQNRFEVLNHYGELILSTVTIPRIWDSETISYYSNDSCFVFNPARDTIWYLPYGYGLSSVTVEGELLISNSCRQLTFDGENYRYTQPFPQRDRLRYGMLNSEGQMLLDTIFRSIRYHNGRYIYKQDDKVFLSDLNNILVDLSAFKSINPLNDSLFLAQRRDGKKKVLDLNGKDVFGGQVFDEFRYSNHKNYFSARSEEMAILFDSVLNKEIEYKAQNITRDRYFDGRYRVYFNGKTGIVDRTKELIIPLQYESCDYIKRQFILLTKENKKGLASLEGEMLFNTEFDDIKIEFLDGDTLIRPRKDSLYACYNIRREKLSDFISLASNLPYRPIGSYRKKSRVCFIDSIGNPIADYPEVDFVSGYTINDSMYVTVVHNKDSIYDVLFKSQTFLSKNKKYDRIEDYDIQSGLLAVSRGDKQAVVDLQGKVILPFSDQKVIEMDDEYFVCSDSNKKYFLFNRKGTKMNDIAYDFVDKYSCHNMRKIGRVVPNQYYKYVTHPCSPGGGDTILKPQMVFSYVNMNGREVIPLEYNNIIFEDESQYYFASKGYEDGNRESIVLDRLGNIVLKTNFDQLGSLNYSSTRDYYIAESNGKKGIIDSLGEITIPIDYKSIDNFCSCEELAFKARDFEEGVHILNLENEIILSDYEIGTSCKRVSDNRLVFYTEEESVLVDCETKKYLKLGSKDLVSVFLTKPSCDTKPIVIDRKRFYSVNERDRLNSFGKQTGLIEVGMADYRYYVNFNTLLAYRSTDSE